MLHRVLFGAVAVVALSLAGAAAAANVAKGGGKGKPVNRPETSVRAPQAVADQLLVGFRPGTTAALRSSLHAQMGARVLRRLPQIDVDQVSVPEAALARSLEGYRRSAPVRFAEPNHRRRLTLPNEGAEPWPYGGTIDFMTEQWGLHNTGQSLYYDEWTGDLGALRGTPDADIDFAEAWDRLNGQPLDGSIVIAVMDSGVECSHEDLAGKCVEQQLFSPSPYGQTDLIGHGTHVAGIAAANTNNGLGIAGVGWNARVADLKVCYEEIDWLFGFVYGFCNDSDIAAGLLHAADRGYQLASMSLAGAEPSTTLASAVEYAQARGMLIVAGAGNAYTQDPMYPAAYPSVVAVGAVDHYDNLASFSSFGKTWVHLLAPGVNSFSTLSTESCGVPNCYGWNSGTSMATPHVSGAAALVWGRLRALGLAASNTIVRAILLDSADATGALGQNFRAWVTNGRLNLNGAVVLAETGTPPPPPPATLAHIGDLDGAGVNQGGSWRAQVTVTVHTAGEAPVAGATVSGTWSGGASGAGSCVSAGSGSCVVSSGSIPKKTTSTVFTVTSVSGTNLSYAGGANHDPDGDSNGTSITVSKP